MRLRNLLVLASLCLLPTACADGAIDDVPPITQGNPPAAQPPAEDPADPEQPGNDNDNDGGNHGHIPEIGRAGDFGDIRKAPEYELELQQNQDQINPCLVHPEDC